jgi:transposase
MESVGCVVGVDWSDQKHTYAVRTAGGEEKQGEFSSRPEAVHDWMRELRRRHGEGKIVIALEQSRGALMYALSMYDFVDLVPINPRAAKAYRDSLHLSGAKDDPVDASLILDFVWSHRGKLRVWKADDPSTRKLRLLVEGRRNLVDQRTAIGQALNAALKQYFPHVLEWFDDGASALGRAFVARWSTLEQARHARSDAVRRLVRAHSRMSAAEIDELLLKIRFAVPLTTDLAIIEPLALSVVTLVAILKPIDEHLKQYEAKIARLWTSHADRALFDSFPGAGLVMAPRLAVAFGSDRSRFTDPSEIQTYSGIAPVVQRSGKHCWTHARWQCSKFLRQSFHEFAECSLPHCPWARAFYHQQRERGAGHHGAIRALAFRWIRILYRCWKNNTLYQEERYLESLQRRGSPLMMRLAA